MCDSKKCGSDNDNKNKSTTDQAAHVRLMEILERLEDKLDDLDQKIEAIGMALFEEIENAGEDEDEDEDEKGA
jgi:hypothetical protein